MERVLYDGIAAPSFPSAALTALGEAATAIGSTLEPAALWQAVARHGCKIAHAEACTVYTYDSHTQKLSAVSAVGHRRDALVGQDFDSGRGIAGLVVRTGKPISIPDARKHPRFQRDMDSIGQLQTRAMMAAPLVRCGQAVGVIQVANRLDERTFSNQDLEILTILAAIAGGAIQNVSAHAELQRKFEGLREAACPRPEIIGDSPAIQDVLRLCGRAAPGNATVLILGETGTGKELIARYIHAHSRRRAEPFVAINCAALPESLLESELFGHEKGSFTGAVARRQGRFELADRGTLFLDEVGEVSRATQAKLLRVLQEKEFVRVGGSETIRSDVRIIAATNRNLKHMMADGVFREDLYYRLSVFPVHLRPLRERREDIPPLVRHFVSRAARDCGISRLTVAPATLDLLSKYEWRGNIRELQNVIERAVLMSDSETLLPGHLPEDIQAVEPVAKSAAMPSTLMAQERVLMEKALIEHDWNQSQAAKALGVTRYYLRIRMRRFHLQKAHAHDGWPSSV